MAESSDLSEWPRSVSDAAAPSARRAPGTATGIVRRVDDLGRFCIAIDSVIVSCEVEFVVYL